MYGHDQIAAAGILPGAAQIEQRFGLQVEPVADHLLPQPHGSRKRIRFAADIRHNGYGYAVSDGLPGHADAVIDDRRAQHLMFPYQPVNGTLKLRGCGKPLHFKDMHQPVSAGFRLGDMGEKHTLLHGQQRINPFELYPSCLKIFRNGKEFPVGPLRLTQVCCGDRNMRALPHQPAKGADLLRYAPYKFDGRVFLINVCVVVQLQFKAAVLNETVYGQIRSEHIGRTDIISRIDAAVAGKDNILDPIVIPLPGKVAQIIESDPGRVLRGKPGFFFPRQIAQDRIARAFIRNPVQTFLDGDKILFDLSGQVFNDNRINRCKPPHGPVETKIFGKLLPAVSFHLDRYRNMSCCSGIAAAYRRQQQIIDIRMPFFKIRMHELPAFFFIHGQGDTLKASAVIFCPGERQGAEFLFRPPPVGDLPAESVTVAILFQCPGIVKIAAGTGCKPDLFRTSALLPCIPKILQKNLPGQPVHHQMVRGHQEVILFLPMNQDSPHQCFLHDHMGLHLQA